jgi:putative DNA primase/helicase
MNFLDRARPLLAQGIPVFPCHQDKRPCTQHGFKDATTDAQQIAAWAAQWPDALVGVPTGKASGLFVLDVDVKGGKDGFSTLQEKGWNLPTTRTHRTKNGGGAHYLFRAPDGIPLKSSAGNLGDGLDTRGDGGYIIWWPAHGGEVEHPDDLADVPPWLVDALQAPRKSAPTSDAKPFTEGARNDSLFRLAASLRAKGLTVDAIEAALQVENETKCAPPLRADEVRSIAESAGRYSDGNSWPDPQPLTAKIAPEPYPLDAMPDRIRAAVEEVQAFIKAPMPLVASSALSALALACQAHVDVARAEKLQGPVSLFLLTIADSGERKSTCDGFFTSAIRQYQEEQAEALKPELKRYQAELAAWEAEREGILSAIKAAGKRGEPCDELRAALVELEHGKPEPPRVPRLILGDETPEALAWSLAKQWPSAGVLSSEGGTVLGAHAMGKNNIMRNLGLLNVLWDGGTHSIGRRTSESFTVKGARLTVGLMVQEATLREYLAKSGALARGSGFLARFLLAWPESTQGYRPFTEPPAHWPHLAAFHRRISEILEQPVPIGDDGALTPAVLSMTPEAKAAWVEYHDTIEAELRDGGELYDVRDVAAKSAENAARLAALFQVFARGIGTISLDSFERAGRIVAWHLSESRRFFGELALPVELADAARLDTWLVEHCCRARTCMVGKNTARQYGPLRDGGRLDAAIRELEALDRLRLVKDGKRLTIQLNPALLEVKP